MKKRTKIELVLFFAVAVFYLCSLFIGKEKKNTPELNSIGAAISEVSTNTLESRVSEDTSQTIDSTASGDISQTIDSTASKDTSQILDSTALGDISQTLDSSASDDTYKFIDENGTYTDKDSVALYIHTFGRLPQNYITKNEAKEAGWDSKKGNLGEVCPGFSIGGDKFRNSEGLLPKKDGRTYRECDIDYDPKEGSRNAKRLIFSNDGLIFYTEDHYNTFELLYGE